eukprot:scaffold107147_cov63-Phaeocystis_antarctica.AAC.3
MREAGGYSQVPTENALIRYPLSVEAHGHELTCMYGPAPAARPPWRRGAAAQAPSCRSLQARALRSPCAAGNRG